MQCISTISFSILINGIPDAPFHPSWGLRQGDILLPYLFLFVSQAFSYLLSNAHSKGLIHSIKISQSAPSIVDVLFTDDTLLFAQATRQEAGILC